MNSTTNHDEMMFRVTDKFIMEYNLFSDKMERLENDENAEEDFDYKHYEAHKLLADIGLYYYGDAYVENDRTKYTLKEWIEATAEAEGGGVETVQNTLAEGIKAGYIQDVWSDEKEQYHC